MECPPIFSEGDLTRATLLPEGPGQDGGNGGSPTAHVQLSRARGANRAPDALAVVFATRCIRATSLILQPPGLT